MSSTLCPKSSLLAMLQSAPAHSLSYARLLSAVAPAYASASLGARLGIGLRPRSQLSQIPGSIRQKHYFFITTSSSASNWPWINRKSPLLILTQKGYLGMRTAAYWRSTHLQRQSRWHKLRNILKMIKRVLATVSIAYSLLNVTLGRHFRHLIEDLKYQARQLKSHLITERELWDMISRSDDLLFPEKQQRKLDEHRSDISRLVRDLEDRGIFWETATQLVQNDLGFWHNNRIRTRMFVNEVTVGWSSEDRSLKVGFCADDGRPRDRTVWSPGSLSLETSKEVAEENEDRVQTDIFVGG